MIQQTNVDFHLLSDIGAVLIILVTIVGFAYTIKNTAENTASKLSDALNNINTTMRDHERRIRATERWQNRADGTFGRRKYDDTDEHNVDEEDGN